MAARTRHMAGAGGCPEAGFTLVEMIVALAILALLTTLLAGVVAGSRQLMAVIGREAAVHSVEPVQAYLRAALAETQPPNPALLDDKAPFSGLRGAARHMTFATFHSLRGQFEGAYQVELSVARTPGAATFDLVERRVLSRRADQANATAEAVQTTTLLSGLSGADFAYYGRADATVEDWQWLDDWPFADRLPSLVRIDVTFPAGDPRKWQRLQVPLQMAR